MFGSFLAEIANVMKKSLRIVSLSTRIGGPKVPTESIWREIPTRHPTQCLRITSLKSPAAAVTDRKNLLTHCMAIRKVAIGRVRSEASVFRCMHMIERLDLEYTS
jgi:hypothetical protein